MLRVVLLLLSLSILLGCAPPRVLVVGLDGATWRVLDPLIDAGYLPNIGGLVLGGTSFDLDCAPAFPANACYCPPVWTTIATGERAGVHGINELYTLSYKRKTKALWDVVSQYGGRNTLIAYRGTWPPESRIEDIDVDAARDRDEVAACYVIAPIDVLGDKVGNGDNFLAPRHY